MSNKVRFVVMDENLLGYIDPRYPSRVCWVSLSPLFCGARLWIG